MKALALAKIEKEKALKYDADLTKIADMIYEEIHEVYSNDVKRKLDCQFCPLQF